MKAFSRDMLYEWVNLFFYPWARSALGPNGPRGNRIQKKIYE